MALRSTVSRTTYGTTSSQE